VVDVQGKLVTRLSDGWKMVGNYREVWNAKGIGSGDYFVRLKTPTITKVSKMTLVK